MPSFATLPELQFNLPRSWLPHLLIHILANFMIPFYMRSPKASKDLPERGHGSHWQWAPDSSVINADWVNSLKYSWDSTKECLTLEGTG